MSPLCLFVVCVEYRTNSPFVRKVSGVCSSQYTLEIFNIPSFPLYDNLVYRLQQSFYTEMHFDGMYLHLTSASVASINGLCWGRKCVYFNIWGQTVLLVLIKGY